MSYSVIQGSTALISILHRSRLQGEKENVSFQNIILLAVAFGKVTILQLT